MVGSPETYWQDSFRKLDAEHDSLRAELQEVERERDDLRKAAKRVRDGLGLTAYEGTSVSVWSAKHYESILSAALKGDD